MALVPVDKSSCFVLTLLPGRFKGLGMENGERYTLGLLVELKQLSKEAADANSELYDRFHTLLRQVSSSNTPDIAKGLTFKVEAFAKDTDQHLRTISLNGNIEIARAAFETAKKIFPNDRWVLLWGAWVVEDTN
jgi:hypothetical protein